MDKKNTVIGALLFMAAFFVLLYTQKHSQQPPSPAEIRHEVSRQVASEATAPAAPAGPEGPEFATAQVDHAGAAVTRLGNSFIEVTFTDFGGAIRGVAFKKYPAAQGRPDPFIFNELHADPMLAFAGFPGLDRATRYELVSTSDRDVVYRTVLENRIEVTRHYILSPDKGATTDPYLIRCETTLRNLTEKPTVPMRVALSIGTAAPSSALDNGLQLTTEYSTGKDQTIVQRSSLEASGGFLGYGARATRAVISSSGPIVWATVKNQFFASILTPDEPADGLDTRRVKLLEALPDADRRAYGITGAVNFQVNALPPRGEAVLGGDLYVGPKEYPRLSNVDVFKKDQDRMMDFGNMVFRFCAALLITGMTWIHGWTANWGIAIILTTLALKFLFLPVTLSQARTARRTQKIAPELKAVREKYKDNPQKQQAATMELYKKHKVNPVAGCIPMLLTIPFFFAFFKMLQSTAELRFAHFLWAHDLSAPDTVLTLAAPVIGSLNINVLPFVLCAVAFVQMRLTPQPTVDNAQMKIMKFMPIMFLLFYYSWSCALSLYSTVNGLFMIGQQLVINRMKDTGDPADARPPGKPVKNVTPRKR
ncbi:MAG TPA: membrane protein insertase YidC [Opitutaceae bacterium]|nr:membrane protein insertase YidC [Opitutaceae bacterium]